MSCHQLSWLLAILYYFTIMAVPAKTLHANDSMVVVSWIFWSIYCALPLSIWSSSPPQVGLPPDLRSISSGNHWNYWMRIFVRLSSSLSFPCLHRLTLQWSLLFQQPQPESRRTHHLQLPPYVLLWPASWPIPSEATPAPDTMLCHYW